MTGRILVADRVPHATTPLDEWLYERLDDVVLVTSADAAVAYSAVLPEVHGLSGYEHGTEFEETVRRICSDGDVERVVHVTEGDLLRLAEIRVDYGIPGPQPGQLLPFRDKRLMKLALADAGIRVARHAPVGDLADAMEFVGTVGYPVVVKPREGAGSRGVCVCRTDRDLRAAVSDGLDEYPLMVEEFVDGGMLHVDGLMDTGRQLSCSVSTYVGSCLSFQHSSPLGSLQLDLDDPRWDAAEHLAAEVIAALPATELSPYHLEIFELGSGELVVNEIAARMGGGHIMEVVTRSSEINPAREAIRFQAGLTVELPSSLRPLGPCGGFLLVPHRAGELVEINKPNPQPWLDAFDIRTYVPRTFAAPSASTDAVCSFVVHGDTSAQVRAHLAECVRLVDSLLKWR
jgi:hypothetical protein